MISAVLFDFDGVIVDSERLHWAAFNKVLEPLGKMISWADYIETYIGFDDRDAFKTVFSLRPGSEQAPLGKDEMDGLIVKKAAAFQELLAKGGAAALPGAVELIKHLSGRIPIAICSGALREDIVPLIGKLGVADAFDTIVTAEDTPRSKPDPAPYRLTAERLGISNGLVIEDTPAGIASAQGAGLKVLAITNSYPAEFLAAADAIVNTLEGITLETLRAL